MGKLNRPKLCETIETPLCEVLESKLCECHCGEYASPGKRFILGHWAKTKTKKQDPIPDHPCECGCLELVAPGKRFVSGHNGKGENNGMCKKRKYPKPIPNHHLCVCSPDCDVMVASNRKFAPYHHLKHPSEAFKAKRKEYANRPEVKAAVSKVHKGKVIPRESVEKQMASAAITNATPESHQRRSEPHKKENLSEETLLQMSFSSKKTYEDHPELREASSVRFKKLWEDDAFRAKMKIAFEESNESRAIACSIASKGFWQDPEYVAKQMVSRNIRPNKMEQIILYLLNLMYPGEWRYTGDFSFMINGKNPDFVNINGQKKLIEFNGTYWHQNDVPGEREKIFAEFGYDTLIIWDHELKDMETLIAKVTSFHTKENPYAKHCTEELR